MIFITSDTHAHIDIGKQSLERFPIQNELTKQDYLIVCGDFGSVWDDRMYDRARIDDLNSRIESYRKGDI